MMILPRQQPMLLLMRGSRLLVINDVYMPTKFVFCFSFSNWISIKLCKLLHRCFDIHLTSCCLERFRTLEHGWFKTNFDQIFKSLYATVRSKRRLDIMLRGVQKTLFVGRFENREIWYDKNLSSWPVLFLRFMMCIVTSFVITFDSIYANELNKKLNPRA